MAINFNISELKKVSDTLTEKVDMPFNQMTHAFLKRRLNEVVEKLSIKKIDQLYSSLESKLFCDDLRLLFSVNTTELFRDASFWRYLRKVVIEKQSQENLNIWIPDLSSGEELYSLLILLKEIDLHDHVKITANHTSTKAIEGIKTGILPIRKMDTNAYNYKRFEGKSSLENYFEESQNGYELNRNLLSKVEFKCGNFNEIPKDSTDIILFRNSMLYYTKEYQYILKDHFDQSLKSGGYLCLGVKEVLPHPYDNRFECIENKEKVYCKYDFIKD